MLSGRSQREHERPSPPILPRGRAPATTPAVRLPPPVFAALVASIALSAAGIFAAVARAGNDDGVLLGNEAAMTGGAVGAISSDGTGAWYNPASVAGTERNSVDLSGSATVLRIAETPSLIMSSVSGRSADGGYFELIGIPSAFALSRRIDCQWTISLGIWVPALTSHTDRVSLDDPFVDYTARWQFVQQESSQSYYAGITLAAEVLPNLRFGVTLYGLYRSTSLTTQFFGGIVDTSGAASLIRGLSQISSLQSAGIELGLGFQWEPVPGLHFGLSVRSPGLQLGSLYRATSTTVFADGGGITFTPGISDSFAPNVGLVTPTRVRLSAAYRFDRAWIGIDADFQHELSVPELSIERRWIFNLRVGGRYWLEENISIGAGFFSDVSPFREPAIFGQTHVDFFGGALGFELHTPHRLGQGESADTIVFSQTFALRYAAGVGSIGGLSFDPSVAGENAASLTTTGTTIHELSLHIGSALLF
jgi:hypothetical protein